jgi:imidazolonepropionase
MFFDIICNEMIPKVAEEKLADFCDVFIDEGYFTLRQSEQILRTALDYGLKLKVHCDELANIGATELCASLGAISVDHLLFISKEGIDALSKSHTIATLLPGTAYFIRMPYAPARQIIDSDVPVSLATDCNPGSCFTENMQIILSLSVINMKMTAEEAVVASTLNAASAIAKSDEMGSIDIGKKANLVMADCSSYTDIFYHFGVNHIEKVWINGITR